MHLSDFDFTLPDALIAQEPRPRGESRLLVVDRARGSWAESRVTDLATWLRPGDLLVANDSMVFPARLLGRRAGGGRAECLLMRAERRGIAETQDWWALVNPGPRLREGVRLDFTDAIRAPGLVFRGEILARNAEGHRLLRLTAGGGSVSEAIERLGHVPLPPYIRRPDTADDRDRYQTIFASASGSIAAPTAGLHFTPALMASLSGGGIGQATVTLHVGYGTFKPVKVDDVRNHVVDPERFEIPVATAERIRQTKAQGGRLVAVGTTTTRALESAVTGGGVAAGPGEASLGILPGFQFRAVDVLLTNFHLPRSSLLLLVCAFGGRELILDAYRAAIARGFRFYSYGDAMLIT